MELTIKCICRKIRMITPISTKEYLADSIVELMQNKSLKNITIKEIAANCHLTSTTFYNHFKDKYDLLSWIYHSRIGYYMDRINESYDWYHAAIDSLEYMKENRVFFQNALENAKGQNSFKASVFDITYNAALKIILEVNPVFSENLVNIFSLKLYFYGVIEITSEILLSRNEFDPIDIAKNLMVSMPEKVREYLVKSNKWNL